MSGSERPIASMPWMARFEMIGLASTAQSASTACAMAFRPEVTCEREGVRVSGASSQTDTRFEKKKKTHRHLWRERQGQVDVVDDGLGEHLRAKGEEGDERVSAASSALAIHVQERERTLFVFCVVLRGLPSWSFSVWPMMGVASEPASVRAHRFKASATRRSSSSSQARVNNAQVVGITMFLSLALSGEWSASALPRPMVEPPPTETCERDPPRQLGRVHAARS